MFSRVFASMVAALLLASCGEAPAPDSAPPASTPQQGAAAADAREPDAPRAARLAEVPPKVPVLEQTVAYGEAGSRNLNGYLAMPGDATEPLPGILVIHEWWGLNDNVKAMTRRLAGEGYVALAVDLYGGAAAGDPKAAQESMQNVLTAPDAARANLRQAYEYLDKYAMSPRIASLGWGLGGGLSLQTALMLPDQLDAVVVYYGSVTTDLGQLKSLQMPVLGVFADRDQTVPVAEVEAFRAALAQAGKRADIVVYPGVEHAFANSSGATYDAEAASDAWSKTLDFLQRYLKGSAR
jgi:carboxymethylenebutenolidase